MNKFIHLILNYKVEKLLEIIDTSLSDIEY